MGKRQPESRRRGSVTTYLQAEDRDDAARGHRLSTEAGDHRGRLSEVQVYQAEAAADVRGGLDIGDLKGQGGARRWKINRKENQLLLSTSSLITSPLSIDWHLSLPWESKHHRTTTRLNLHSSAHLTLHRTSAK